MDQRKLGVRKRKVVRRYYRKKESVVRGGSSAATNSTRDQQKMRTTKEGATQRPEHEKIGKQDHTKRQPTSYPPRKQARRDLVRGQHHSHGPSTDWAFPMVGLQRRLSVHLSRIGENRFFVASSGKSDNEKRNEGNTYEIHSVSIQRNLQGFRSIFDHADYEYNIPGCPNVFIGAWGSVGVELGVE